MEIYLIQRLTYLHYVLLAITVIVGLVTVIYTVDYIGPWVCEEPEFGREKKFVRRSLSLFVSETVEGRFANIVLLFENSTDC